MAHRELPVALRPRTARRGRIAGCIASARAELIRSREDRGAVAASIVRTSGWPGATEVIVPFVGEALDLALQRSEDVDPESDNDELVDAIQSRLPDDGTLIEWIRDPSFGTLSDRGGSSRTGVEMLPTAADCPRRGGSRRGDAPRAPGPRMTRKARSACPEFACRTAQQQRVVRSAAGIPYGGARATHGRLWCKSVSRP